MRFRPEYLSLLPRICLALLAASGSAMAEQKATLIDSIARLHVGQAKGNPSIVLTVEGLDKAGMAEPQLVSAATDLGLPAAPPTVVPKLTIKELPIAGKTSRSFALTLDVDGLPVNSAQPRFLNVTIGGTDTGFSYSLSNVGPEKFSWTVKAGPIVAITAGNPIPVSIAVGNVPARGIAVLQAALIEKNTRRMIAPGGLRLCEGAATDCVANPIKDLERNVPRPLWLWGATEVGVFEGSVTLSTLDKTEGDSVPMTIYSSTDGHRTWGVIAIFVGVVFAWFGTAFVRNRINRDQLLAPVSAGLQTLRQLDVVYQAGKPVDDAPNIEGHLRRLEEYFSSENLEAHGLPGGLPAYFVPTTATSAADYKTYAQAGLDWIAALGLLIQQGLTPAWQAAQSPDAGDRELPPLDAIERIDALAETTAAPALDALHTALAPIMAAMLRPKTPTDEMHGFAASRHLMVQSPEQIQADIRRLNLAGWLFALVGTTLAGAYILVIGPNADGFGTRLDYLQCLLWGFGLPTGAQLMLSTTGTISTSFGVPKY